MTLAEHLQDILDTHHLSRMQTPCSRCGYDIWSHWTTEQHGIDMEACVFCYPPRGFHTSADHLYQLHPRPKSHQEHLLHNRRAPSTPPPLVDLCAFPSTAIQWTLLHCIGTHKKRAPSPLHAHSPRSCHSGS